MAARGTSRSRRLPGMAERTVTISGLSKTYSITGWRLAYTVACERLTSAIRKVHDFLTVGAPHPLQEAGAAALKLPPKFYADLAAMYERKRATLYAALTGAGLKCRIPRARTTSSRISVIWDSAMISRRPISPRRGRRRRRAGIEFLSAPGIGEAQNSLHVLEERRNPRPRRRAPGETAAKDRIATPLGGAVGVVFAATNHAQLRPFDPARDIYQHRPCAARVGEA